MWLSGGISIDDDSESAGVAIAFIAGDEQVLRAGGLEGDEQMRFVAAYLQAVRDVLRKRCVRAGLDVDALVANNDPTIGLATAAPQPRRRPVRALALSGAYKAATSLTPAFLLGTCRCVGTRGASDAAAGYQ